MSNFYYVLLLSTLMFLCMCQVQPIGNNQIAGQTNTNRNQQNYPNDKPVQNTQGINPQNPINEKDNLNNAPNTPNSNQQNTKSKNQEKKQGPNNQQNRNNIPKPQQINDQAIKKAEEVQMLEQAKQKQIIQRQKQQQIRLQKQQRQRYAQMRRKQQEQLQDSYNTQGIVDSIQKVRLDELKATAHILNSGLMSESKQFTFQVIKDQQFVLKVPAYQQFVMIANSYVLDGEHYRTVNNLNREGKCKISISKQNEAPIIQRSFYFQTGVSIGLEKDKKYILRFSTTGNANKLITMKMKYVAQHTSLNDKLLLEDNNYFSNLVVKINHQFDNVLGQLAQQWMLDHSRAKDLNVMTKSYFSYEIFEIIFTVMAALVQLRLLSKLLKGGSLNII